MGNFHRFVDPSYNLFAGESFPAAPGGTGTIGTHTYDRINVTSGGTGGGGVPVRDDNGNIIEDVTYNEAVLYDRGGMEYKITVSPTWLASDDGKVRAEVTVEKLSDPIYPLMKGPRKQVPVPA